jgi:hypothetical protein
VGQQPVAEPLAPAGYLKNSVAEHYLYTALNPRHAKYSAVGITLRRSTPRCREDLHSQNLNRSIQQV